MVAASGVLAGHGSVSSISGAGMIAPGGSQILTATQLDPGSGIQHAHLLVTEAGAPS